METPTISHIDEALFLVQRCLYARNLNLYRHSLLTANIAYAVAADAGVDFDCTPAQAYIAGVLHDVGKIFIPDEILEKRLSLNAREWEVMKRHPAWGRDFVRGTQFESYGEIIENHHECQENNYPVGLAHEQVGSATRLIALADRVAAYLDDRPYRRRITHFGLVCREVKNSVKGLFPAELSSSIEPTLRKFAVDWINKSSREFETALLPVSQVETGNVFRHVPCVSPESGPDGCGVGRCQKQLSSAVTKGAGSGCS